MHASVRSAGPAAPRSSRRVRHVNETPECCVTVEYQGYPTEADMNKRTIGQQLAHYIAIG
jgi:hypothetical protein